MKTVCSNIAAIIAILVLPTIARAADPWDIPFSADSKAIVEAAQKVVVPADQELVMLLEQHEYKIDEVGRTLSTSRKIFRILKQDALEDWSSVEQEYHPWYESRPELRARVIDVDGGVHWLDPKTIADNSANEDDPTIFSDSRTLRAPLPSMAPGVIVEYEIVQRETAPLFDAGVTRRINIFDSIPIHTFRLSIEANKNSSLRIASQLIPEAAIHRETVDGLTRVTCELGPLDARKTFESNLPPDTAAFPYVSFSTGNSWQAIATRYESIVDRQIQSADLKPTLDGLDLKTTPQMIAAGIAARLHRQVRYTGVEFGEAEIVPRTPDETLKRAYGDCKDKAALMVAMLRAAGLKAYVAILHPGFGTDVDQDLPGLGVFDHAIVYVDGNDPMWIDATADQVRVGDLPIADQGRLALIASRTSTALLHTPESPSSANVRTHAIEIHMSDLGPANITETVTAHGSMEGRMRSLYDGANQEKTKEALERYVKNDYLAKSLGKFDVSKKDDLTEPFHLKVEAVEARRSLTEIDDAVAVLNPDLVFRDLPYELRQAVQAQTSQEATEHRKHDFIFPEAYQVEYDYKIFPPSLFGAKSLPPSVNMKLGSTGEFTAKYTNNPDGTIEAAFRLDTGKRRLSPEEFDSFRQSVREHSSQIPELITFVSQASEYVALGEIGKALKLVRENASKHPEQQAAQVRLSRMLVTAGSVDTARVLSKTLVERDPNSPEAWRAQGSAFEYDSFGRAFAGNWSLADAEKSYREAVRLAPQDFVTEVELATLLEHNSRGQLFGNGAQLDEAISVFRNVLKTTPESSIRQNLALALLYAGRYSEAKEEIKRLPASVPQAALSAFATAATENPARAIIETQSTFPDDQTRAAILSNAAVLLLAARQYDRATELLGAVVRLTNVPGVRTQVEMLSKLKRHEDLLLPSTDPRYPVQQMVLEMFSDQPDVARLKTFFTKRQDWTIWNAKLMKLKQQVTGIRIVGAGLGLQPEGVMDLVISSLDLAKTGDENRGYRITGKFFATGGFSPRYVIREDGEYKILGSADSVENIGSLVLELLAKKDIASAQWWLDTVVPDLQPDSEHERGGPAARFLWAGRTTEMRGPAMIEIAAASLIGRDSASERAIQILSRARSAPENQAIDEQIDLALCESLEKAQKWDELLLVAKRRATVPMFAADSFPFYATAYAHLGRWKDLQDEAQRRLGNTSSRSALRIMATSMAQTGNRAGELQYLKKLADDSFLGEDDEEFVVWRRMLLGDADMDLLTKFDAWRKNHPELDANYWYALGMLQVSLHKADDAKRSLASALDRDNYAALDARPWILLGKIYDEYGEAEAARNAYQKARSSPHTEETANWALSLVTTGKEKANAAAGATGR